LSLFRVLDELCHVRLRLCLDTAVELDNSHLGRLDHVKGSVEVDPFVEAFEAFFRLQRLAQLAFVRSEDALLVAHPTFFERVLKLNDRLYILVLAAPELKRHRLEVLLVNLALAAVDGRCLD